MHPVFLQEAKYITKFFRMNNIKARVDLKNSIEVLTGYFRFGLTLHPTERFTKIESTIRELSAILSENRVRQGLPGKIHVIPTSTPLLALETPHPNPKILKPSTATLFDGLPCTMSVGKSYLSSPVEEVADLTAHPHYLIAGITGAGKSVMMQEMILSLAARTDPKELKLCLVDLKNEDLLPLASLPHVLEYAGIEDKAMDVLRWVEQEKLKRIEDPTYKPYRLVLVIDEMAHLAGNAEAKEILGKLITIGRSKEINLIGATQHPTQQGGLGSLMKANFTVRLVGQVAPGQSQYATNRPHTHADLLPGKGSFLWCSGPDVYRFQSYYISPEEVTQLVCRIATKWKVDSPVKTVRKPVEAVKGKAEPVKAPSAFPIGSGRPLTVEEQRLVGSLALKDEFFYGGKISLSRLASYVYGFKDSVVLGYVKEALGRSYDG
jgi:DNA segregation ATPase FtsK/SpoIIIE, S-DNA-T family